MKPLILLTNDDGFYSEGIETLSRHLKKLGQIFVVAPDREQSATSLSLTLHRPLKVKKIKRHIYAVDGTPADCIYLAARKLLPRKPSLLISGINRGPNLGQQDISYSGTVAGAIQGTFLQIPSAAISLMHDETGKFSFDAAAKIAYRIAKELLKKKLPAGVTLNINIPPLPIKGIKIVKLGQKRYNPEIIERTDPRKRTYYWIGTGNPKAKGDIESDVMIAKKGYITITPLHTDLTDYQLIQHPLFNDILENLKDETF
ncbi:MAG: 5'/3'-nucleotidase SurE [Candidatus Aminicenantes bacterium]|nr:MAG: 5'/3'-nucleotidase SurE [Candidatus Aminicenantes bacterium]